MDFFLTENQIRLFRSAGFIKSPFLIDSELLNQLDLNVKDLYENPKQPFRTNGKGEIFRVDNLVNRNSFFYDFCTQPKIINPLQSLLGQNIELAVNRQNNINLNRKDDFSSSRKLHRDVLQWSRGIISVLIYIDDSTIETGCTEVIPTSQYFPFTNTNKNCIMEEHSMYEDLLTQAIPIPMKRGSVLFLDGLTFHTIGDNITDKTRTSIALAFHSVDEISGHEEEKYKILVHGERFKLGNFKYES